MQVLSMNRNKTIDSLCTYSYKQEHVELGSICAIPVPAELEQLLVLQSSITNGWPSQVPPLASTVVFVLIFICLPPPQLLLHLPILHGPHWQLTGSKFSKLYFFRQIDLAKGQQMDFAGISKMTIYLLSTVDKTKRSYICIVHKYFSCVLLV